MLFFDPMAGGCTHCPANLLLLEDYTRRVADLGRGGMRHVAVLVGVIAVGG